MQSEIFREAEMSLYEENRQMMKKYGIIPKKKYGQNFLTDETVLENIVANAEIEPNDFVIEIGPGLGNLTKRLCEKAGYVAVIEIDKQMVEILKNSGFAKARFKRMTFGICTMYFAEK